MSEPFIAEIRVFSFAFAPKGWAFCNGQILAIAQNQALFSLLGTTYGGNGTTTFALPNIQGRFMVGPSNTISLGQIGGEVAHTLTLNEMPVHTHMIACSNVAGASQTPSGNVYGVPGTEKLYTTVGAEASAPDLLPAGGSQPHNNVQPCLGLNVCMALVGIFPSRN